MTPQEPERKIIGEILTIAFCVWLPVYLAYRKRGYWMLHVKRWYLAASMHRRRLAGVLGLVIVLVGIWRIWDAARDENAPHCSYEALEAKRCQAGDWIAVDGVDVPRYCDFNKKIHILHVQRGGAVCHYVGRRLSR